MGTHTATDKAEANTQEPDVAAPSAEVTPVGSTRASRAWIKVLPLLVVLAVFLMFVLQNSRSTKISFATASGRLPVAVALLASAALGALLVLAVGSIRILQLRKVIRRSPANPTAGAVAER
jgi:uncharacterized integral membrane protein